MFTRGTIDLKRTTDRLRRGRIHPARGTADEYATTTANRELEQMIKQRIAAFEKEHGTIPTAEK